MSYELNDKIVNLVPYEPIAGDYKIRLDANECPFGYSEELMKMVYEAADSVSFNRYPDPVCLELRKSFADFYGIDYRNVTVGNGSDELIFLIETAFLKKGQTILTASPDFSMYDFYSSICEVEGIKYIKNERLDIEIDSLIEQAQSVNAGLIIFSNPCNPTGQGVSKKDCEKLLNSTDALVVLDEAYMDFWDESESFIKDVNNYDNLIVFRTASKAIGSAALRLGFAAANEKISKAIAAVKSPYNVNSLSQAIGTRLYKNKDFLKNRVKTIVENTKILYNELVRLSEAVDGFRPYPAKTNFVFVRTDRAKEIWEYLKANSVAVRLMGGYLRITAGAEDEIDEVVSLINKFYFGEKNATGRN